jgi:hypothetical protein
VNWSCERIATVAIHLRTRHAPSPAIEDQIRKRPPFKRPEDRWKAYYCELFAIPSDCTDLVPSPYFNDNPAFNSPTPALDLGSPLPALDFDSPLPADWQTAVSPSRIFLPNPINPHASSYATTALQLTERYQMRLGELQLRASQAEAQLRAIEVEK